MIWVLILTLLMVLMFLVIVVLGFIILKHIESLENEVKDIYNRIPFIQGMIEAISDMVRPYRM